MARIGRYCIDRYEAHLVRREGADRWVMHSPVERLSPGVHYEARSEPGVYPQAYISRNEAQEACRNAGKRLCTWIEWRRGCQGRRWLRYPYGWSERRGRCNTGKAHVLPELFGFDTSKWHYEEVFNSPLCNLEPGYLATSGSYEKCVSDDQIYDMVGNLHEWVSTPVTEKFLEVIEKDDVQRNEQPWREGNGMFLGGFYSTTSEHGPGCMYVTMAHEPSYHDYSTGFRCCKKAKGRTVRMRPKR